MSLTQEPLIGGFFIKSAVFTNVNDRFFMPGRKHLKLLYPSQLHKKSPLSLCLGKTFQEMENNTLASDRKRCRVNVKT